MVTVVAKFIERSIEITWNTIHQETPCEWFLDVRRLTFIDGEDE
jgi:hypothetical protein